MSISMFLYVKKSEHELCDVVSICVLPSLDKEGRFWRGITCYSFHSALSVPSANSKWFLMAHLQDIEK